MNERIYELALQAQMAANNGDHVDVKIMMAKFGVLIVKECMYVGRLSQINNGLVDSDIKEHFNIE